MKRNRLSIIFAAMLMTALTSNAQLMLDERVAVLDSLTSTWLCSIPEECFGSSLTAEHITMGNMNSINIDGKTVSEGYTFDDISGTKTWTITGTKADGTSATSKLQFTFLPIVDINSLVEKNVYNTGAISVYLPDENITTPCRIKYRGSATNSHVYLKRNYTVKLEDEAGNKADFKFFEDLRNDNAWILDAGTLDRLRIRNRVLTDLWMAMGSKPYYSEQEPKALNASRGKLVEVFRRGEYQGVYNMCEPIDRKQMKLKKMDEETGEVYGQLWKSGQRTTTTKMMTCPEADNFMNTWDGFEVSYPDFDDVNPTDYSTLYNAVNMVVNSSDKYFAEHAHEYLDVPVLIDIYLYLQILLAYDNMGKNLYWATYDHNEGPKITPAVWDLDTSLGQSWKNNEYHPTYLHPEQDVYTFYTSNIDWFLKRFVKWNVGNFNDIAAQRYNELRKTVLATDSINQRFVSYIDMLKKSGTAQREEKRWVKCSDLGSRSINFDEELNFVTDWISKRMEWLDKYFGPHPVGDITFDGCVDISDANILISSILHKGGAPDIYTYRCDLNNNKDVDIYDFNMLINTILGK